MTDLKRTVEALLFASPESLSIERLQAILPGQDRRGLRELIAELRRDYDDAGHAFELTEIAGGWRVQTRPAYTRHIETLLKGQRRVRLSRAALEVLAVVAYRQPCARTDVEAVRGVNCGGPLATLLERGLVRITGRSETLGRPLLYGTTSEFLAHLGVNRIEDLPQLTEIETLLSSDNGDGELSALAPEEKRARLESGMENLAEALGDLSPSGNGNGDGALTEDAAAHEELLKASLAEERSVLGSEPALPDSLFGDESAAVGTAAEAEADGGPQEEESARDAALLRVPRPPES